MAIEQTQVLPAPVLEAALTAFTQKLPPLMGQTINTASYAPKVAGQNTLQQTAQNAIVKHQEMKEQRLRELEEAHKETMKSVAAGYDNSVEIEKEN